MIRRLMRCTGSKPSGWGVAIAAAVLTLVFLEPEAEWLLHRLSGQLKLFLLSMVCFLIGYLFLWREGRWIRVAIIFIFLQYAFATFAYGIAHLPYIVYPYLTVGEAFTNINTFYSLLKILGAGIALLLPGFLIFWRFFLKDKRYLQKQE